MTTHLEIDDALVREAQEVGCHKSKEEAVTAALREYVQRRHQREILALKGAITYFDDYDPKASRRR